MKKSLMLKLFMASSLISLVTPVFSQTDRDVIYSCKTEMGQQLDIIRYAETNWNAQLVPFRKIDDAISILAPGSFLDKKDIDQNDTNLLHLKYEIGDRKLLVGSRCHQLELIINKVNKNGFFKVRDTCLLIGDGGIVKNNINIETNLSRCEGVDL